jgi:DNA-binding LacI/PurR family transcriptional regulator
MAVTMRDVAERAGVSIKTVSRVVNNQGEISEATRRRVRAVIEELGYRPNTLARGLVSGRSHSVGMVIPRITDPFFPEVVLGAESVAQQAGYSVILCNANGDPDQELRYVDVLEGKRVDGIILCGSVLVEEQLNQVSRRHCISVLTSHRPRGAAVVSVAEQDAFARITKHLLSLGHTAIGHIPAAQRASQCWRLNGYTAALGEHDVEPQEAWVYPSDDISVEAGHRAALQLLRQAPEVTAIAGYNDLIAVGVLEACSELGLSVPGDIAVTGFDDIELASLVRPRLTSVRMPRRRLGEELMKGLLRRMQEGCDRTERTLIELELVVRESSGAKREG